MSKIGIMGGTFDPVHNGHLLLGRQAYAEYGLESVWFMPSGQPPHKRNQEVSDGFHRCAMVKLAIEHEPSFRYSDFEFLRSGNTYTAQTMKLLKEAFPRHQFYYIIGADSLYELENWYHPEQVMTSVPFLVAGREYKNDHRPLQDQIAYLESSYNARICLLHCQEMDISSAGIRQAVREGQSIEGLVPQPVREYIAAHNLYGAAESSFVGRQNYELSDSETEKKTEI